MMDASNHSTANRSHSRRMASDLSRDSEHSRSRSGRSPSIYFKNVVSLSPDKAPMLPSPRQSTPKATNDNPQNCYDQRLELPAMPRQQQASSAQHEGLIPSAIGTNTTTNNNNSPIRSRRPANHKKPQSKRRRRRPRLVEEQHFVEKQCCWCFGGWCSCCKDRKIVRSTLSCMNVVARILAWSTIMLSLAMVVWYSYELTKTRKDPHLILWNSAGAFVLIGFPISIYGIVMHLANYNQPETQVYIVRILFMVPIFSIQSWLGLRFKDYSIYFETIRDFYESFVLYSFLQFLIQVLGGEEALILMLKDKSPTRGVHIWGMQFCLKPWLMGQPVRKTYMNKFDASETILTGAIGSAITASETAIPMGGQHSQQQHAQQQQPFLDHQKPLKRVYWTSPFFLKCKFGVLQYVLLKLASTIAILILEPNNMYKEGSFSYKGGYLYICILTNVSQTWALYCFFFFYFATKNELTPIRPVGKFLSVKLLVFFTWWQSLFIAILEQMQMIPHYISTEGNLFNGGDSEGEDPLDLAREPDWSVPLSAQDAMALDLYGGKAFWPSPADASSVIEYSPEDVAKALQDYLICIEMFLFAIVHIFVFPHSEYAPEEVEARARALNQMPNKHWNKRLGRKWKEYDNKSNWSGTTTSRESAEIELSSMNNNNNMQEDDDDLRVHPMDKLDEEETENYPLLLGHDEDENTVEDNDEETFCDDEEDDDEYIDDFDDEDGPSHPRTAVRKKNFFSALLDSTIPQDLRDNTVGIIKGEYVVERKTLLHHAATSDSYDLLSRVHRQKLKKPESSNV